MDIAGQGATSAQILPVDVYGSSATTTSWDVALGVQAAVNNGATVLNLSLGGTGDSAVLDDMVQQAMAMGFRFLPRPATSRVPRRPIRRRFPGVNAVTAVRAGDCASYANYGNFVDFGAPGNSVVYLGNQACWFRAPRSRPLIRLELPPE